jgi:hypothetical protein
MDVLLNDVFAGNGHVLGFAIPSASRVYVHYGRIHALARRHRVPPGWFLGVVFAHELGHVLLPRAGHSTGGIIASTVRPDSQGVPTFMREQAQSFRARLRHRTVDREEDKECPYSDGDGS